MTLDEFYDVTAERMPTAREFVNFVHARGWEIETRGDKASIKGVKEEDRDLGLAVCEMLKTNPLRERVFDSLIHIALEDLARVLEESDHKKEESPPKKNSEVRRELPQAVVPGPKSPEQCNQCRAMVFGEAADVFACCDHTPCPYAPSETWWKKSKRK